MRDIHSHRRQSVRRAVQEGQVYWGHDRDRVSREEDRAFPQVGLAEGLASHQVGQASVMVVQEAIIDAHHGHQIQRLRGGARPSDCRCLYSCQ
jgi:hypothetical protein